MKLNIKLLSDYPTQERHTTENSSVYHYQNKTFSPNFSSVSESRQHVPLGFPFAARPRERKGQHRGAEGGKEEGRKRIMVVSLDQLCYRLLLGEGRKEGLRRRKKAESREWKEGKDRGGKGRGMNTGK